MEANYFRVNNRCLHPYYRLVLTLVLNDNMKTCHRHE